jgi:hypothetical protein
MWRIMFANSIAAHIEYFCIFSSIRQQSLKYFWKKDSGVKLHFSWPCVWKGRPRWSGSCFAVRARKQLTWTLMNTTSRILMITICGVSINNVVKFLQFYVRAPRPIRVRVCHIARVRPSFAAESNLHKTKAKFLKCPLRQVAAVLLWQGEQ